MKIVCDWDDLQVNTGLTSLLRIKEHYPNFRCTAFTIPMNQGVISRTMSLDRLREWAKIAAKYDWIEFALHGFMHIQKECVLPREKAEILLSASEKCMSELGLPYVKVFKAPFWQASTEMYECLRDRGYTVAVDRNQQKPVVPGLKTYVFNWSFDEVVLPQEEWIKGHGHFEGTNNDILLTMGNFLKNVPPDAEFHTVTEYLKATGVWNEPSV